MLKQTVTFKNGQEVSALGQGTYRMGYSRANEQQEIRALRTGLDLGLTVIDTAENYHNEELVGKAIREVRDTVFLVSKVEPRNASRQASIVHSCEQSLKKLGTDVLDLYLLHWEGSSSFDETVAAMTRLQQAGKIRQWGVSNMDVPKMERFMAIADGENCAADQVAYNVATRGTEYDLLPWCTKRDIVFMAYSPIGEGDLVRNKTLISIGKRHQATAAQIALAWSVRQPNVLSIPKASTAERVAENARSLSIQLTEEDILELDNAFPPPTRKMPFVGW